MELSSAVLRRELVERNLLPKASTAACLVGSWARGWNNALSDVDVYAVCLDPWRSPTSIPVGMATLTPPAIQTERFHVDEQRWEVTFWTEGQVDQMFSKITWAEFDRELPAEERLTPREELFLARLVGARPIIGDKWLTARLQELHASAYRSLLVSRSLAAADEAVQDTVGQLDNGDLESAVLSARRALGLAIDALLEFHGEYGSQQLKWRPNRFRSAQQSLLSFDEYWALETMRDSDAVDPRRWIDKVVAVYHKVSLHVEI